MLALGLILCSLLCRMVNNSKTARNLHGMFHDVQTTVKNKQASQPHKNPTPMDHLAFQFFQFKSYATTPFERAGTFYDAGGSWLV